MRAIQRFLFSQLKTKGSAERSILATTLNKQCIIGKKCKLTQFQSIFSRVVGCINYIMKYWLSGSRWSVICRYVFVPKRGSQSIVGRLDMLHCSRDRSRNDGQVDISWHRAFVSAANVFWGKKKHWDPFLMELNLF